MGPAIVCECVKVHSVLLPTLCVPLRILLVAIHDEGVFQRHPSFKLITLNNADTRYFPLLICTVIVS